MRYLIVNADDFGQSPGINRGIIEAHERGIVTAASLMVRHAAVADAATYARAHPGFSVGLHVDLGEWAFRGGAWTPVYSVAVSEGEIRAQVDAFHNLMGRDPTHIDSHQHAHRSEPVCSIVTSIARELRVPLRHEPAIEYCGSFYGQARTGEPWPEGISVEALLRILATLPEGVTELGCHPGYDDGIDSMYVREREQELAALCDPRIRQAIADEGIVLCSFLEIYKIPVH